MDLVKGITSDHDLIELAEKININLDGIATLDEIDDKLAKEIRKDTWLILLRRGAGIGHWVATCDGKYFDSMGVGPPQILGKMPYNEFQYQGTAAEYCGIFCLLNIYATQKKKPELLRHFTNLDIDIL